MRKSILVLFTAICSLALSAQSQVETLNFVENKNAMRVHQSCTFKQHHYIKMLDKTEILEGELRFSAPYFMDMFYSTPEGKKMVITDQDFFMDVFGKERKFKIKSNKNISMLANILLRSMEGNVENIAQLTGAKLSYELVGGNYVFTLIQEKPSMRGYKRIDFTYSHSGGELRELRMEDASGNYDVYVLGNYTYDAIVR